MLTWSTAAPGLVLCPRTSPVTASASISGMVGAHGVGSRCKLQGARARQTSRVAWFCSCIQPLRTLGGVCDACVSRGRTARCGGGANPTGSGVMLFSAGHCSLQVLPGLAGARAAAVCLAAHPCAVRLARRLTWHASSSGQAEMPGTCLVSRSPHSGCMGAHLACDRICGLAGCATNQE